MILHTAMFTWREGVTEADVDALTFALKEMAGGIPELHSYHCGPNLRLRPSDVDYVVSAVVDDAEGLTAYLDSAGHQEVYARHLAEMIAERSAAQCDIATV